MQDDSGAAMHLMQDELDFVAGWSSSINITAGTARKDDTPTRLNRVGPVLRVFRGKNGHGENELRRCSTSDVAHVTLKDNGRP